MIKHFVAAMLLMPCLAYAGSPRTDLSVQILSGSGGGNGGQCTADSTILPTPPTGYCWSRTFDEEFTQTYSDPTMPGFTNLNPTVWSQGGDNTGSSLSIAHIPPGNDMTMSDPSAQNITQTPNNTPDYPEQVGFYQKYGYFVASTKMPVSKSGDEIDLELFAQGTYSDELGYPSGYGEWNFYVGGPFSHPTNVWCVIRDPNLTNLNTSIGGPDLSAAYHQYGFLWLNNGSTYGTGQCLFDGVSQNSPYTLQGSFGVGAYFDLYGGGDTQSDPMSLQWVRAYKLVSNKLVSNSQH